MGFKYGDLIVKCHQCGEIQVLEELVTEGRAVYLFNDENSYLKLHCPKCDITMEMSMRPSVNVETEETIEEVVENEELQEEITAKEDI